jgi:hypothetical protein
MAKIYVIVDWENSDILAAFRSKSKALKEYRENIDADLCTIDSVTLQ